MNSKLKTAALVLLSFGFVQGCIVREEPPRRRVVVVDPPPPPPPPVEVVPVSPGPEFVYEPGVYVRVGGGWGWRHGGWHRR